MEEKIAKVNHYLSQSYLKQWESSLGKIWIYRTLVSHENVPLWKEDFIKSNAFYTHLYSRMENGKISDEIEHWFNTQFETRGLKVIQKVLINDHLKPFEWHILINYLALHDLRTPARLQEYLERAQHTTKEIVDDLIKNLPKELQSLNEQNLELTPDEFEKRKFPLKVTPIIKEGEDTATLKIETDVGRASWLDVLKHQLEKTSNILQKHRWTILYPSYGSSWFTTDKPVMRLNYGKGKYDFNGGWNSKGTEIFFPLSPEHILYTKIGHKPPIRGTRLSSSYTKTINKLIVEHAYRYVFHEKEVKEVEEYKPRTVDNILFTYEKEFWRNWHFAQANSENFFF